MRVCRWDKDGKHKMKYALRITLCCVLTLCLGGTARAEKAYEAEGAEAASALRVFLSQGTEAACREAAARRDTAARGAGGDSLELAMAGAADARADSAALHHAADSVARLAGKPKVPKVFVPDPKRALWLSLVFPGAGQIYNRKYWKLPIIYGGFLGCAYALMWNQQMYRDYSQAYLDIMDDDPNTKSYLEILPARYDITGKEEQFKSLFKRKKDYYRRYRDLSAFCFVGVYLISVIDAYVDAQLSVFDITPDLSMSVEPAVIGSSPALGTRTPSAYGVGCSLRF